MVNDRRGQAEQKASKDEKFARRLQINTGCLSHLFAIKPGNDSRTAVKRATFFNDLRIYR
jgi:hypothetical protein